LSSEPDLKFEGYVTKFAPQKALNLSVAGTLTLDERVVLHLLKGRILDIFEEVLKVIS